MSPTALVSKDINLLCSTFKDAVKGNITRLQVQSYVLTNTFSADDWKSVFYSKVDSTGDIGTRLREIEKTLFRKSKDDILKSLKTGWSGSAKQNEVADAKIR